MDDQPTNDPQEEPDQEQPAEERIPEVSGGDREDNEEVVIDETRPSEPALEGADDVADVPKINQDDTGWVSEIDTVPEEEWEAPPETSEKEVDSIQEDQPQDSSASADSWWGDAPFMPIESLDDEDTQPVRTLSSDKVEEEPAPMEDEDSSVMATVAAPTDDEEPDIAELEVSSAGDEDVDISVTSAEHLERNLDDIPTIPPPDTPPDWTPQNLNLPQHVGEVDHQATRVTPAAYQKSQVHPEESLPKKPQGSSTPKNKGRRPSELKRPKKPKIPKKKSGCFLKVLLAFLFLIILGILLLGSFVIYQYFRISASLPNVNELREHAAKFETTRILDRNGNLLYEILDPNAGRRTYVPLEKISPYMIAATIATEDKDFFTNPGFDIWGVMRALWQNYSAGEIRSGASTITQQLARALLMDPSERYEQSYERKAREIVLAFEITRRYSKEDILELYLNENFYANMAYGVQAASETYFNTSAESLNLWQASFLAGLPQGPSIYDIYNNREATLYRQRSVLVLMYELSQERDCIDIGQGREKICVSLPEATQAGIDLANYEFPKLSFNMRYPHWVVHVRSQLEAQFDPQTIYRSGFTVYTTLDPELQAEAEKIVAKQVAGLAENNATNGALLAMDPNTGEILAFVGSVDFYDETIDGQVNMVLSQTRQPGSAIKPLTYVAAFEKGWTPSTLIWDVPSRFPPSADPFDTNPEYEPVNYDGKFHGPVTVRSALANSYNIPAVKALEFVGIYDDPDTPVEEGLIPFLQRLGVTSLTRDDYGLALTLGGGEISLMEMTAAYSALANQGRMLPQVSINKIIDRTGNVVYEYEPPIGDQVIRAEHAYLITSILSDTNARIPMFGTNPVINLAFPAAVKTGTTNDFRDNWTIGYTPDLVVGAWVGNTDYSPMTNTSGLTGAGPIWAEFMTFGMNALNDGMPSAFVRPPGIVDRVICAVSGTEPSEWCPQQRSEIFAADQLPKPKSEDLWKKVTVDTWTGLSVSDTCSDYPDEKFAINVDDPWAKRWLKEDGSGQSWAQDMGFSKPLFFVPERACRLDDPRPVISISGVEDGQTIKTNPLRILGIISATENFDYYRIEWGRGSDPLTWKVLVDNVRTPQDSMDILYEWDLEEVEPGMITLKFYVHSTQDTYAEKLISFNLQLPTPTPTNTPTSTSTPTRRPTRTPTPTPTPTSTPTSTRTPTDTVTPTTVPTETLTPTVTITATSTLTEVVIPTPTETPIPTPEGLTP